MVMKGMEMPMVGKQKSPGSPMSPMKQTIVRDESFNVESEGRSRDYNVTVGPVALMKAQLKVFTLKFFELGDSPLADAREQVIQVHANVGLVSALFLTIVLPNLFDTAKSMQTNALIATNPGWVGSLYFMMNYWAFAYFCVSTMGTVFSMIGIAILPTDVANFWMKCARNEMKMPILFMALGISCFSSAMFLWLTIVSFSLYREPQSDIEGFFSESYTGTGLPITKPDDDTYPNDFPVTYALTLITASCLVSIASFAWARGIAIMYKAHEKFQQPDFISSYYLKMTPVEIWGALEAYFLDPLHGARANVFDFKEYLLTAPGSKYTSYGAINTTTDKTINWLFEKKMEKRIMNEAEELIKGVSDLDEKDDAFSCTDWL